MSKTQYSFLFLLLISNLALSSGWKYLNPYPSGQTYRDVYYSEAYGLWLVGDYGTLISSDDKGESWIIHNLDTESHLYDFEVNQDTYWIVGKNGCVLYSSDFGKTWNKCPIDYTGSFVKIQFINSSDAVILASDGYIAYTHDAGLRWQLDSLTFDFQTNYSKWPYTDIYFTSPDTGWLALGYYSFPNLDISADSHGALLKTIDGGQNWIIADSGFTKYTDIFFLDKKTGWLSTTSVNSGFGLFYTSDKGKIWKKVSSWYDWQKMYFFDFQNG
jgi:photosystem II stability/assembly factor-like uncharacterized protein